MGDNEEAWNVWGEWSEKLQEIKSAKCENGLELGMGMRCGKVCNINTIVIHTIMIFVNLFTIDRCNINTASKCSIFTELNVENQRQF